MNNGRTRIPVRGGQLGRTLSVERKRARLSVLFPGVDVERQRGSEEDHRRKTLLLSL